MKKSFGVFILSAFIAALVWICSSGRYPDMASVIQGSREHWADVTDMGLAREYIREKLPIIQRIIEITYRSFGLNG